MLGPLNHNKIVLITLKTPINALEAARKPVYIIVWYGPLVGIFLSKNGFPDFITVGNTPTLISMLKDDRADA